MWAFPGQGIKPVSPALQMNEEGLPGGSEGEESACNAGAPSSIPGLGRYPEEGNGNPSSALQGGFLNLWTTREVPHLLIEGHSECFQVKMLS